MEPDICRNYHKGNPESFSAWCKSVETAKQMREGIFSIIKRSTGITCEEIEILTGWKHQSVSARISELKRDQVIRKIGTRKTQSGRMAAIYKPFYSEAMQTELF